MGSGMLAVHLHMQVPRGASLHPSEASTEEHDHGTMARPLGFTPEKP